MLFLLPFVLAFIVWLLFPPLVEFVLVNALKYPTPIQSPPLIWSLPLIFFYTWYVFSAIGVGGLLVVAVWMWKQRPTPKIARAYPLVSLVVPAYNQEQNIMRCINSLFKCAIRYRGSSEIIIIDDGSTDNTFNVAWATMNSKQREVPSIRARVVRHMASLGKAEAMRTGVNKAMGEYVAIVDANTFQDSTELTELVDYMQTTQATALSGYIHRYDRTNQSELFQILQPLEYSQHLGILRRAEALGSTMTAVPDSLGLYRVEALRQLLNENRAPVRTMHRRNWLGLLLLYNLVPGFLGPVLDLVALLSLPIFFWFAPDRVLFVLALAMFLLLVLTVGIVQQTFALKFAYNQYAYKRLLWYSRLYYILRLINIAA